MIHLVHQIDDLKLEARHKDKKIKVLGKKLQLVRKQKLSKGRPIYWRGRRKIWQSEKGNVIEGKETLVEEKKIKLSSGGVGEWWRGKRKVQRWRGSGAWWQGRRVRNRQTGMTLAEGWIQSPETSIDEEKGFNSTQKPAGGRWPG